MATINGTAIANLLNGTAAADTINGLGGNDTLNGLGGNDRLDGGTGNDSMVGGAGNDLYIVDAALDKVVEGASAGTDTVQSSVTYTLAANVENLTLTGAGNINATGNTLNNVLTGNAGLNRLTGSGGDDTLNGLGGKDTLVGGAGNDTYVADSTDVITEAANQGTDTLQSTITRTLSGTLANIENLTLTGATAINGTGNGFNNVLTGNTGINNLNGGAGNDTLNGGAGTDTLIGGTGNDTYIADSTDVITEAVNQGIDTLQSTITRTLSGTLANIENLTLTGNTAVNGTGNNFNNVLTGNGANNTLNGLGGNDTLSGGVGVDSLLGGVGNDNLDGGAGADRLRGEAGNDVLIWDAADVVADGGTGTDTLRLAGETDLNLITTANSKIVNIEAIDLVATGGANVLTLNTVELQNLSTTSDTLRVDGGAGDAVIAGSGWAQIANVTIGAQTYAQYTKDGATLQVDTDINAGGIGVSSMSLGNLDGANGFRLDGVSENDVSGSSFASAGDVNGDGYDDLIVGAFPANDQAGESYVVFGKASGFGSELDLSALDGVSGFRLNVINVVDAGDQSGYSVASAGDVNGDGYDDLIVGARHANSGAGESYVVFGKASFGSVLHLFALDGENGFRLDGTDALDVSGSSVASAGDVNGDGYDDLIVGANRANGYAGESYVVFGKASGFDSALDLSALDGANGFRLDGIDGGPPGDRSGFSVASAGDVNGDGYDDLIVGTYYTNGYAGESYVVFGKSSGFDSALALSALDGVNGFRLDGSNGDSSGRSVASAGDVNGDGYDDLIVGASGANVAVGASYVVFGKASGFDSALDLSALDGTNGFRLDGIDVLDFSGSSVASAGDVNGDGYDDLIIGAESANGIAGASYVVFGKSGGFGSALDLSALDGTNGFRLDGSDVSGGSGSSVASAGDVNGDGYDDLLVGAPGANSATGASYVIFGRDFTGAVDFQGTAGFDSLSGGAGAEVFVAGGGNDVVFTGGGADVVRGGSGDDVIQLSDTAFADIDGGSGADRLLLISNGQHLDLTAIADSKLTGIEVIALGNNNTLTLNALEILNLSDTTNTLRVEGGAGDAVVADAGWERGANTTIGAQTYAQYTKGGATLQVDTDIDAGGIGVASMSLGVLDGDNGFRLDGIDGNDQSGISVASAGDVNGDGYDDLIVGTYRANDFAGESYVVFGKASGFGSELDLSALDGANGFRLDGIDGDDRSGRSVASAGDVNGDGYDDLVVGASSANGYAGESYVVFGKASGFDSALDFSALDGTNGFRLDGIVGGDNSGRSVASAGDVNGDGYDDLIVGAYNANGGAGESYVVFGKASGFDSELDLSALDGTNGFRLDGINSGGDRSGYSVASAGDVNGDGYDDLIVGAYRANSQAGESYVVFGKASGFDSALDLSALDGANGFRLDGIDGYDRSGRSVASAGDVNGDGYDDLIVGAPYADPNGNSSGESYVVFGRASGFDSALDFSALDGTNGFRLDGIDGNDGSGFSVTSAGDVNGDGYDDLIVGASKANGYAGESYVVFGKASGFGSELDLSALDGANGFRLDGIDGGDQSGRSVASAGDVNGDGYDDLLVGAFGANSSAGESYVIFGRDFTGAVDFQGTAGADTLTGTGNADVFVGGTGNDLLVGIGGADVFRGGAGDDRILIADGGFLDVDGGSGSDTLALDGSAMSFDLTVIADSKVTGIEAIDLTGSGDNTLTIEALDVLNLSGTTNTLRVDGNANDAVIAGAGWERIANATIDSQTYAQYTKGGATLQVDTDIDASGIGVAAMSLGVLDGDNGFEINGEFVGDKSGYSVSAAGDVNGDGYDDLLIGAWARGFIGNPTGASYVVFGRASGFGANLDLSTLDGANGFEINGELAGDKSGHSVSAAGDVNGDGYDDLLIGAHGRGFTSNSTGASYVVFGQASGFGANLDLSTLDGANGFELKGESAGDLSGFSVSTAGDVNGDGYADLLIGAWGEDVTAGNAGASYVVFGQASGFGANLDLSTLDGANGFALNGESANDYSGRAVSNAGDVNGDGYDDLLIGAHGRDVNGNYAGASYVVFGRASGFGANLYLSTLDGANGFEINGESANDNSGFSVSNAGDVNGDGYADLLIGAHGRGVNGNAAGASYVVFGQASGFGANLDLSTLDGANGFELNGESANDYSGRAVSTAGDVNGDGYDDLLIGAWGRDVNGNYAGASYVVFGRASGFGANLDLSTLDGANGFEINGESAYDLSGFAVSAVGDVNGDGYADLLIGAHNRNNGAGSSYVIYGRDFTGAVDFMGTAGVDSPVGTAAADVFVTGRGSDLVLLLGGGADVVRAGAGNDQILLADTAFADIDGGTGTDELLFYGDGMHLDLTALGNSRLTGIEIIDLQGTGDNLLTLALDDVLDLSDTSNTLTIDGNGDDSVTMASGGWSDGGVVGAYHVYTAGAATLRIHAEITNVDITII